MRLPLVLALGSVLLLAGSAGASSKGSQPGATASAYGIRVVVPGQAGGSSTSVSAPPNASGSAGGFAYPSDGSAVTTGALTASASTAIAATAHSLATISVSSFSLFGGEPQGLAPTFRPIPFGLQPQLTAGGYVFPVYGPHSFSDTFGAFRGDVPGNWHHGDDIFAPLGAPILACADGAIFSVGWNNVGGNRLWLRDGEGNEFYYAHLSAYSPAARNGNRVKAGEVIGFVGNTGDAEGTPYHLHFEVHPVGYLALGYDGAVDPTPYLLAWQHQKDLYLAQVAGYIRGVAGNAPKPGAILLQASDISEANGLDPASLRRALFAPLVGSDSGRYLASATTG